ncbi:MAG: TPM domain-containing protein [Bacteroidales bacterium]|nr:TPM domain-containing protein [Bacteroidales bacterium]
MFFHHRLIRKSEERKIVSAITEAEKDTSGEIRVHIERWCKEGDPVARAIFIFDAIGMFDTRDRTGVLIYISLKSRLFAVIGDVGINAVIPQDFWNGIKTDLSSHFSRGQITEGIIEAVNQTGKILKEHFPCTGYNPNEQPDEISYGK